LFELFLKRKYSLSTRTTATTWTCQRLCDGVHGKILVTVLSTVKNSAMAIKPQFEEEDEWEQFLARTNPTKKVLREFPTYSWTFGLDEDDEGYTRDCVTLDVPVPRETEPRQVAVTLKPSHLTLSVKGKELINDNFVDDRWLSLEESYWELETKTNSAGERQRNIKYNLFLRVDCPKYITGALFEKEKVPLGLGDDDSDDDTADNRIRTIANLKEPEPRRDDDVYFSEDEEFSDYECEGCGSKSVECMKKSEDREFKIYCNDCPYVSSANVYKEAPSIRRQREVDEARAKKKKEKDMREKAERLALENTTDLDLLQDCN